MNEITIDNESVELQKLSTKESQTALIQKAAEGDMNAQYNYAYLLDSGKIFKQNRNEAIKWFNLAADKGHISAQAWLLNLYAINNKQMPQSFVTVTYQNLERSARANNFTHCLMLGALLFNGRYHKIEHALALQFLGKIPCSCDTVHTYKEARKLMTTIYKKSPHLLPQKFVTKTFQDFIAEKKAILDLHQNQQNLFSSDVNKNTYASGSHAYSDSLLSTYTELTRLDKELTRQQQVADNLEQQLIAKALFTFSTDTKMEKSMATPEKATLSPNRSGLNPSPTKPLSPELNKLRLMSEWRPGMAPGPIDPQTEGLRLLVKFSSALKSLSTDAPTPKASKTNTSNPTKNSKPDSKNQNDNNPTNMELDPLEDLQDLNFIIEGENDNSYNQNDKKDEDYIPETQNKSRKRGRQDDKSKTNGINPKKPSKRTKKKK